MPPPSPKAVIEAWVRAFNSANVAVLASLYSPDAVNHQVADGREAIRQMFEREFSAAQMTCIFENLLEDREWAVLEWRDPLGLRGCGIFRVIDGKITSQPIRASGESRRES